MKCGDAVSAWSILLSLKELPSLTGVYGSQGVLPSHHTSRVYNWQKISRYATFDNDKNSSNSTGKT